MTPQSGEPRYAVVSAIGKLKRMANARKAHAAKNFPNTADSVVIGRVNKSSTVPVRFSSDHKRMPAAGIRKRNSHGCQKKNVSRLATPPLKKPLTKKARPTLAIKKTTRKT